MNLSLLAACQPPSLLHSLVASSCAQHNTGQCHATGAIDALTLLDKYIAPGCVLLFDDLINYPDYRDHEILALWEWLQATGRKLEVHCSGHHCSHCVLHALGDLNIVPKGKFVQATHAS